jgi:hypothetical protein
MREKGSENLIIDGRNFDRELETVKKPVGKK